METHIANAPGRRYYWVVATFSRNTCQFLFYIYWYDYMIFILYFDNVVYHRHWFTDIAPNFHPRNKPTLPWHRIFLMYCWIWLMVCCWEVLHLCSLGMLAYNFFSFFFLQCLFLILVSGNAGLIKWVWYPSLSFNFLE